MISGANEKELDLATARTDILLMCGTEQLKIVDEYYENQITNLQQRIDKAIEYIDKRMDETEDEELQWIEMGIIDYWKELNDLRQILGDKE